MRLGLRGKETPGGWRVALGLSVLWAFGPAIPALMRGGILGSPYTDLYPSVWGLGWFVSAPSWLPNYTTSLAAPEGMGFYYSSPLHGWAATVLVPLFGVVFSYNLLILLARGLTVFAAYGAGRAAGLGERGALVAGAIYGTSPFFHGYSVEGIVEGTDGWTLALLGWALAAGHPARATLALGLTIWSSWYLGMVGVSLVVLSALLVDRRQWMVLLGGLGLAAPALVSFAEAFPGIAPMDPTVRSLMGATLKIPRPGVLPGEDSFAINNYLGWITAGLALMQVHVAPRRSLPILLVALGFFVLSTGWGPWYELPVLRSVRFAYRWHAGTLLMFGWLAGMAVEAKGLSRWVALAIMMEGLLLSPVEPLIPSADAEVPGIYDQVRGPLLLEVPGPVAMPPGVINLSRPRARYLLYFQLQHGAASPWAPDFNGVGARAPAGWLTSFRSWDPLEQLTPTPPDLVGARAAGVTQVMLHRDGLGQRAGELAAALVAGGAQERTREGQLVLFDLGGR